MRRKRRTTSDPFLHGKVAIFFLAAGIWLAGVLADSPWLTGAAIALLALGLLLRFLSREREEEPEE